jgi:hypothetical protein
MIRVACIAILLLFAAFSLPAPDVINPPSPIPEPSTMLLVGGGIVAVVLFAKNRKSRR